MTIIAVTNTTSGALQGPFKTAWQQPRSEFSDRLGNVGGNKNEHLRESQVGERIKEQVSKKQKKPRPCA
jgi:hypothetical protein